MDGGKYQISLQTPFGVYSGTIVLAPAGEKLNGAVFFNNQRYPFSGVRISDPQKTK